MLLDGTASFQAFSHGHQPVNMAGVLASSRKEHELPGVALCHLLSFVDFCVPEGHLATLGQAVLLHGSFRLSVALSGLG